MGRSRGGGAQLLAHGIFARRGKGEPEYVSPLKGAKIGYDESRIRSCGSECKDGSLPQMSGRDDNLDGSSRYKISVISQSMAEQGRATCHNL